MAGATPLAIGIDASAGVTVPGGLDEVERSSTRHGAQSSQQFQQKSLGASLTRPPGQGGGPARPDERRACHSAHTAGLAGRVKVTAAHSRPQDRSNVGVNEPTPRSTGLSAGWENVTVRPG